MGEIYNLEDARNRKRRAFLIEKELSLPDQKDVKASRRTSRQLPAADTPTQRIRPPVLAILVLAAAAVCYVLVGYRASSQYRYSARANLLPSINLGLN